MSAKTTSPTPAVGQRWADNDKRLADKQREVVIRRISVDRALCDVYESGVRTRSTLISIRRFKPIATGYRYVGEGAP